MTSILFFRLNKGKQVVIVGDTQHTHESSTKEESKIDLFNDLLFCGSGYDRIIWDINKKVNNFRSLTRCANKILALKNEKIREYQQAQTYGVSPDEVQNCDFMIINTKNLKANKILLREVNSINQIGMIGSGSSKIGEIQEMLGSAYGFPFGPHMFKKIIGLFNFLGRHDPLTGHPAIFPLEVFLLEKNKESKRFIIKFKPKLEENDNYEIKQESA